MTVLEQKTRELEAQGTVGYLIVTTTALGLAVALAQHSYSPAVLSEQQNITLIAAEGTRSEALASEINELDLFQQINRVYDDLLKNQVELDADSKRALYTQLWDLYT
jgi:hypothetical protein